MARASLRNAGIGLSGGRGRALEFVIGGSYSRIHVKELVGRHRDLVGGSLHTEVLEHDRRFLIFTGVAGPVASGTILTTGDKVRFFVAITSEVLILVGRALGDSLGQAMLFTCFGLNPIRSHSNVPVMARRLTSSTYPRPRFCGRFPVLRRMRVRSRGRMSFH